MDKIDRLWAGIKAYQKALLTLGYSGPEVVLGAQLAELEIMLSLETPRDWAVIESRLRVEGANCHHACVLMDVKTERVGEVAGLIVEHACGLAGLPVDEVW